MPDNLMTDAVPAPAYENRSATITELAKALSKAQGAMENASKDRLNTHFSSKYATLGSVWDAIRKPLADNGLSILQFPRTAGQGVEIETTLLHNSGEFVRDVLWVPCSKNDAQGLGSAVTYGRKYALMAVCGIAPSEDDDGNAAAATTPRDASPPARGSSANGRRMAAEEPHLVDHNRPKGSLTPPAAPADKASDAKRKAKEWATDQVIYLNENELSLDELRTLEETNRQKLDWMQSNTPEAFDKFYGAFSNAIERATKREAA